MVIDDYEDKHVYVVPVRWSLWGIDAHVTMMLDMTDYMGHRFIIINLKGLALKILGWE